MKWLSLYLALKYYSYNCETLFLIDAVQSVMETGVDNIQNNFLRERIMCDVSVCLIYCAFRKENIFN